MATFTEYINVLEALASAPGGLTAGQVRRQGDYNMDTQKITRILKLLERDGMVWMSRVAYRPNVEKVVWRIRQKPIAYCNAVKTAYDENEGIRPPENADSFTERVIARLRAEEEKAEEAGKDDLPF
jgi:hypothetical protein